MKFYSLNKTAPDADFKEATLRGQAPDKGLYFPRHIPAFDPAFLRDIGQLNKAEIAFRVIQPYAGECIPDDKLMQICTETVNFEIPLVWVTENMASLELFHGPTLAFKDIGARFMSRCLAHFVAGGDRKVTVLVATSGDTGGAVANGFYNVPGVEVVILYPSGKVSSVQEQQLTTLGKNIRALEVKGNFDECQRLVKLAFADSDVTGKLFLTSANSINIARWLPQQFYYLFAYQQWNDKDNPPVFCVPSGNFGNICAGMLAQASGLPVKHFIAAVNANNTIPRFLENGQYAPQAAVATLSNAMDVADPSNFVRILELFAQRVGDLKTGLTSESISDEQTRDTLKTVFEQQHYLTDPHGAVAWLALQRYLQQHPGQKGIFLETAHPVKFFDVIEPIIGQKIAVPESVTAMHSRKKIADKMEPEYAMFKDWLLRD